MDDTPKHDKLDDTPSNDDLDDTPSNDDGFPRVLVSLGAQVSPLVGVVLESMMI